MDDLSEDFESVDGVAASSGAEWTVDDIEAAYRRALEAAEEVLPADEPDPADDVTVMQMEGDAAAEPSSEEAASDDVPPDDDADSDDVATADVERRLTPEQVVEAVLFVGGEPVTTKKLCGLLGERWESDQVEDLLSKLNEQYRSEARPYEVRMSEGGYRLVLRSEYERIRHRVHGTGPKEVKLSQDALEVLAFVAYRQPVTKADVEATEKRNASNLLRQLIRRELIVLERPTDPDGGDEVVYVTTERFLNLFGLGGVDELPQAEELGFK